MGNSGNFPHNLSERERIAFSFLKALPVLWSYHLKHSPLDETVASLNTYNQQVRPPLDQTELERVVRAICKEE